MVEYSRAVIYKIYNDCGDMYIGATTRFRRRYTNHRCICNNKRHRDTIPATL